MSEERKNWITEQRREVRRARRGVRKSKIAKIKTHVRPSPQD
jgi:hypothetical protein